MLAQHLLTRFQRSCATVARAPVFQRCVFKCTNVRVVHWVLQNF